MAVTSALRASRRLPPRKIFGTRFCVNTISIVVILLRIPAQDLF
jgi:hypothetical protein